MLYGGHKGFALVHANALSPSSIVEFAVGDVSYPIDGGGGRSAVSGMTCQLCCTGAS